VHLFKLKRRDANAILHGFVQTTSDSDVDASPVVNGKFFQKIIELNRTEFVTICGYIFIMNIVHKVQTKVQSRNDEK